MLGALTPGKIRPRFRCRHIGSARRIAVEEYSLDIQSRRYLNPCTHFLQEH
jgi:hypothetical protein